MKNVLKWLGIVLGGLFGLAILVFVSLNLVMGYRLSRRYSIEAEPVAIPTDEAARTRGAKWVSVLCVDCHGDDLAGQVIFEDPMLGHIASSNLTPGRGGVGGGYTDADWVRAIRHGVGSDGRPLLVMPSTDSYYLGDQDLGDIIAYVKSVPPVDKESGGYRLTPLARMLGAVGAFGNILHAETIDHSGPRPPAPPPGVTEAYGEYLVNTGGCRGCHGQALAGGSSPNPDSPPALNLTPGSELAGWTAEDFKTAIRTGETPSGHHLDPEFMPWKSYAHWSDDELSAVWLYLQSLPRSSGAG
jgi:mono/diheme cytochrome c family protein